MTLKNGKLEREKKLCQIVTNTWNYCQISCFAFIVWKFAQIVKYIAQLCAEASFSHGSGIPLRTIIYWLPCGGEMSHWWWRRRIGYWHLDFPGDFKSPGLRRRPTRGRWSHGSSYISCDWLTVTRSPNRSPRSGLTKLIVILGLLGHLLPAAWVGVKCHRLTLQFKKNSLCWQFWGQNMKHRVFLLPEILEIRQYWIQRRYQTQITKWKLGQNMFKKNNNNENQPRLWLCMYNWLTASEYVTESVCREHSTVRPTD